MKTKIDIIPFMAGAIATLLVGGAVAGYVLFSSPADSPLLPSVAEASVEATQSTSTLPALLIIPTLGINAVVQHVGVTAQGDMGEPSNFTDVAWYRDGPEPGQEGSAVIGGHLDNALALNGVFKHLDNLKVGDEVDVQTEAGTVLEFRVTDVEVYPYLQVPPSLFTKTGGQYLNLITCAGTWLWGPHSYDHRLVVYTTLVN